jgi:Holliday junction DNA helicase RuvA
VIAFVRGSVAAVAGDRAVIDVGGVGLSLVCAPATLAPLRVGQPAELATALVVREDSLTLYGFGDADERAVFEVLQTVSGIGPKLAQAALAVLGAEGLRAAVAREDLTALTQVPGVGRKGAQRMVLDLKDRLSPAGGPPAVLAPVVGGASAWREQVHAALLGLGWAPRDADEALAAVAADPAMEPAAAPPDGSPPDVAALLRAALRSLSRG